MFAIKTGREAQMAVDTPLERLNFFQGQLLSAEDLRAEQAYFLEKLRRHNRHLHGWGVVSGLRVALVGGAEVVVGPGVAIDCAGNEIHVCAESRLALPGAAGVCFVALSHVESEVAPVPALAGGTVEGPAFARIREGFRVEIAEADPVGGHRGRGAGTPGCGEPHPLCIARLRRGRRGWTLALCGRRRG